jgi:hypothetical protein
MRGAREPSQTGVRAAHLAARSASEEASSATRARGGASSDPSSGPDRPSWVRTPSFRGGAEATQPSPPPNPKEGRLRAAWCRTATAERRSAPKPRVSLAGDSPKREARGPSVGRSRGGAFTGRPRGTHGYRATAEAEARGAERPVRGSASRARTPPKRGRCAEDTQREFDDTFPGVRPLSAKSARAIVSVPAYLTDTIRPQGFSPSRRLDPARALWVCFTPHPPIGFWPSELFPRGQASHLSVRVALLPFG